MRQAYIDTNILVRFFTHDDEEKALSVKNLLKKAEEKSIELIVSLPVFCEIVYVLGSSRLYNFDRTLIAEILSDFICLEGIIVEGKLDIWEEALDIFSRENIDFEDAFLAASLKKNNIKHLYSFDKDFDRFDFLERLEP